MSCGRDAFALAATRINSSPVSCARLMGSWPCLLFGRFAACSAGGVTTGSPCAVQPENSDIGLASHIERLLATRLVQASLFESISRLFGMNLMASHCARPSRSGTVDETREHGSCCICMSGMGMIAGQFATGQSADRYTVRKFLRVDPTPEIARLHTI